MSQKTRLLDLLNLLGIEYLIWSAILNKLVLYSSISVSVILYFYSTTPVLQYLLLLANIFKAVLLLVTEYFYTVELLLLLKLKRDKTQTGPFMREYFTLKVPPESCATYSLCFDIISFNAAGLLATGSWVIYECCLTVCELTQCSVSLTTAHNCFLKTFHLSLHQHMTQQLDFILSGWQLCLQLVFLEQEVRTSACL